jgi:hypothetical protein
METLSKDSVDTIFEIAKQWIQGVAVLRLFDGSYVILAVTRVDYYNPSNNIHHTTISGKDIRLLVEQKMSMPGYTGPSPVLNYIDNIKFEQVWEISHTESWFWCKIKNA